MKTKRILNTICTFMFATVLAAVTQFVPSAHAQDSGLQRPNSESSNLEKVKADFIEIKSQLEVIQSQALATEEVKQAIAKEDEALKSQLLATVPEESKAVEEFFETRDKLAAAAEKREQTEVEELKTELYNIGATLGPSLEEASNSEVVKKAREDTSKAILTAMSEIDPRTPELIQKQQELFKRYRELAPKG